MVTDKTVSFLTTICSAYDNPLFPEPLFPVALVNHEGGQMIPTSTDD
ncbi:MULTISPECIES: hypothetical protein [Bartonella]|nr:hypothetical protein [Bartonella choladocola]MBI0140634.1 hypothetical protein [Bartonella choladocola]